MEKDNINIQIDITETNTKDATELVLEIMFSKVIKVTYTSHCFLHICRKTYTMSSYSKSAGVTWRILQKVTEKKKERLR